MTSCFLELPGWGTIHYKTSTPSESASQSFDKPVLIFLHYWGGSARTWRKVISGVQHTHPTAAIDLPGWGRSTLAADRSDLSIASHANAVFQVLSNLPPVMCHHGFILVGHSMGAKIGMAVAAAAPKDSLNIRGMTLVAPAPPSPFALPPSMQEQQRHAYDSAESVEWVLTNVLSAREKLTDEDLAVEDSLSGAKAAKEAWPSSGMAEDVNLCEGAGMKIVVLAGELDVVETKDRVEVEVVERLQSSGYDVSFRVVEGAKHLLPLECPDAILKELSAHF